MKTKMNQTAKTTSYIIIAVLILFSSCDSNNGKSGKLANETSESKLNVKPPNVDISTAAFMGDLEAVKQHITAGSDLDVKDPFGGSTPLITASIFGRTEVALTLIKAGADLDAQNNDGSTPLHCAALFCNEEIVASLIENGADKTIKNNFGDIPSAAVNGPFSDMIAIYDFLGKELGPLGLKLDYEQLEKTRPVIAELLK